MFSSSIYYTFECDEKFLFRQAAKPSGILSLKFVDGSLQAFEEQPDMVSRLSQLLMSIG